MKKIIQITEENYKEIFSNKFQYKIKNKFIIFVSKKFPSQKVIYYCFKLNTKNNIKFTYNIYGKFIYYKGKSNIYGIPGVTGINVYDFLEDNKVFIF